MKLANMPIRRKVMAMLLLTSGVVLLFACLAFIGNEYFTVRQTMLRNAQTLAQVLAINSSAALAFDNGDDARETLAALKAETQVVAAAVYDGQGQLFATYLAKSALVKSAMDTLPPTPGPDGFRFEGGFLVGQQPIFQGDKRWGTLYLKSDQQLLYTQLRSYSLIAAAMTAVAFVIAYALSRVLQRQISGPVLRLAETADVVSRQHDYSVRAQKSSHDEVGALTDAFNQMLAQIQAQDREVRDSETRVRAVLNSALSAVIVMDGDGAIVDWNRRAEQIFGWQRHEALGRKLAELIIPVQYRQAHQQGIERYLHTGEGRVLDKLMELTGLRRDGSEFPIEISVNVLRSGEVARFCGFITDITERKQIQTRIQAQLNRLDQLQRITRAIGERQDLNSIFQVVLRNLENHLQLDFSCICLYDASAQSLTVAQVGAHSQALAVTLELTEQTHVAIDENGLSRCVRGQLVYEPELSDVAAAFPRRLVAGGLHALVMAPLLAESKVFGLLVVARCAANTFNSNDCEFLRQLSEHVALASHQAQLYTALQQAYDDLRQSQHIVLQQERLRVLGQIASGVAHDINNAISPVSLYAEALLQHESGLSERARTYLTTILRAIEDVAQTVSRMREFYRPREQELSLAQIDLNTLVHQVIELTRARWRDVPQERGIVIELRTDLALQLPAIMGADNEIRDALTNLVFNAVDAMPEGGTLTLRTYSLPDQEAPQVVLEVADTGIGMDEQTRQRCLEPFYTTKGERGTGLGLAMVYGMVQRHSADLRIDSTIGEGTTFKLVFPTAQLLAATERQTTRIESPSQLRILLIDDDPLIIESMRDVLESDGHQVFTAEGGQAGVATFTSGRSSGQHFDVVITDLGMPYMDGRRVATAIKVASPNTPVILLTGWGQRMLAEKDIPEHVDRVLNKPPKLQDLRRTLIELVPAAATTTSLS